jgi:stage IV sporulation protein FB
VVRLAGWSGFDAGILAVVGSVPLTLFLDYLLYVCLQWGLINLLPVYPLDGGQIARELFMAGARDGLRQSMLFSALVAATVAALALLRLHDFWIALLFGYLAYGSFTAYQAASNGSRPW